MYYVLEKKDSFHLIRMMTICKHAILLMQDDQQDRHFIVRQSLPNVMRMTR